MSGFQPRGMFWKLGEARAALPPPKEGTLTALALFHATWASIPPPTLGPAHSTPPSGAPVALTLVGSCVTVPHDSFPLPRSVWWPPDRHSCWLS